jgi:endonuclease-3
VKIEFDLMELFPRESWTLVSHQFVAHGRALCNARKPLCGDCFLLPHCPHGQALKKRAGAKS